MEPSMPTPEYTTACEPSQPFCSLKLSVRRGATHEPAGAEIQVVIGAEAPEAVERYARLLAEVIALDLGLRGHSGLGDGAVLPHLHFGLPPSKLVRVQEFIDEHLADTIRVAELAAVVHMSAFHFARLFKQATGRSPHAYLTILRVDRAKALLRDERLALVHIAAAVGFQTQGHFTEVFHRHAGITPRRYRLMNGRNAKYGRKEREEPAPAERIP
jgi:transcriptional regulator GlxA family with amidase domain